MRSMLRMVASGVSSSTTMQSVIPSSTSVFDFFRFTFCAAFKDLTPYDYEKELGREKTGKDRDRERMEQRRKGKKRNTMQRRKEMYRK